MNPSAPEQLKPKMLVLELWGLGDLSIATPFLRAACEKFQVTLLAKPHALGLQEFWPDIKVIPFTAPWTPFRKKYRLHSWPWRNLRQLFKQLRAEQFDIAISARWDPRDHVVLKLSGAKEQWGFPRLGSELFLSYPMRRPEGTLHRYGSWKMMGDALGLNLELPKKIAIHETILIHSGSSHPARVWPLDRFQRLIERLRRQGYAVRVICDAYQKDAWVLLGETEAVVPQSVPELLEELKKGGAFIGNDSGPGHLASLCGVPTFTIFGSQFAEAFLPLNPAADFIEGKPCPYKPCYDSCRFATPHCLMDLTEPEVWAKVDAFVQRQLQEIRATHRLKFLSGDKFLFAWY